MNISIVSQPETQLGNEIDGLLAGGAVYPRIVFVSAFVALRTILRLRERLLEQMANGTRLRLTVGIDLGGTSREVLEELLRWNCETFVFHNTIARATFHPKVYLFESAATATFFVGSNNLTDGGLYTNYEAATRYDFDFPADAAEYERLVRPLAPFLEPQGATVQRLTAALIQTLAARGELISEAEARQRRRIQAARQVRRAEAPPENPFAAVAVPRAPLPPRELRAQEPNEPPIAQQEGEQPLAVGGPRPNGVLVWQKRLPRTDALQVPAGTHSKGAVQLTQAGFENPPGQRIRPATYFRQLFAEYQWEPEPGKAADQEHTFVPMRIFIRGRDFGVRNFEISHNPTREADQNNYTTNLRWGRDFTATVVEANLTGAVFSLFETGDEDAGFLIEITNP